MCLDSLIFFSFMLVMDERDEGWLLACFLFLFFFFFVDGDRMLFIHTKKKLDFLDGWCLRSIRYVDNVGQRLCVDSGFLPIYLDAFIMFLDLIFLPSLPSFLNHPSLVHLQLPVCPLY